MFKGGRIKHGDGYILIYAPTHPAANHRYVFEHRLVMEKTLGRYLTREEIVHHIDGDKANNVPENLMLFPNESTHQYYHGKKRGGLNASKR